jgi:hypothetical protein
MSANTGLRVLGWLVALTAGTLLLTGCSDPARIVEASRPVDPPPPPPPVPVLPEFPAVAAGAEIYLGDEGIYASFASFHGGKIVSRYVFYPDGSFALQFLSARFSFVEYRGTYTRTDSRIKFEWEGWSVAGNWEASALLEGDRLSVAYNIIMWMTDFLDGVYIRVPATR